MSHVTKEIARELTKTHSNFHTRETWGETQRNKSEKKGPGGGRMGVGTAMPMGASRYS